MANHDLSNVTTSALKRELEKRGWTVHLENGPTAGPSFFELLGDNVHHLLPFLEMRSLCRLDAAMTSREGREIAWLPRLAGLESADLVLKEVCRLHIFTYCDASPRKLMRHQPQRERYFPANLDKNAAAWLAALRWLVARGVSMPERLQCPRSCDASQFTACFEHCTTAGSTRHMHLINCSGAFTVADMINLQCCTGLKSLTPTEKLLQDDALWEQLDVQNWLCFNTLEYLQSSSVSVTIAEIWGRRFSALVSISIEYRNDGSLEHLCEIKTLQDVILACYGVETAAGFADLVHLTKLPALRGLSLQHGDFIDAALGHIRAPSLRELVLDRGSGFSTVGAALIVKRFHVLEKLSADGCEAVTDADLAVLSQLASLQQLSLRDQQNVTDAGVAHLSGLTCLQHLDLSHTAITNQSLSVIGRFTQLRELDFSSCLIFDDNSAVMHLRSLTNLINFNVSNCGFTDAGLDSLHAAANLETLVLGDSRGEWLITRPALERLLAACPKLKVLGFAGQIKISVLEHAKSIGLISDALQAVLKGRGIRVRGY